MEESKEPTPPQVQQNVAPAEPTEKTKKRLPVRNLFGENSLLIWILMLLAVFTILAGTLWMHTHAQNQKLRAELKKATAVWVVGAE